MKMIEAKKVVPLIRLILFDNPNIEKICKGMQDVVNIHTIEAEPVKNGMWETNSDRPDSLICSICKCGFDMWKHDPHNYCPYCGAKMYGDGKEGSDNG